MTISNGLVYELMLFMEDEKLSWSALHTWLSAVTETLLPCSVKALTAKVRRLQATRAKILKASDHKALSTLMNAKFCFPESAACRESSSSSSTLGVVTVSSEMPSEVHDTHGTQETLDTHDAVAVQSEMQDRLSTSHDKVRNLGKKLRRRDGKLSELGERLQEGVEERMALEDKLGSAMETVEHLKRKLNNVYCRASYEKAKTACSSSAMEEVSEELAECRRRERELRETVKELHCLLDLEKSPPQIISKVDGKYTAEVRQCCYELLAKNVGVWNVAPVIRSVLALANMSISDIPSAATLSQMLVELRQISHLHVAHSVADAQFTTGHSDGTSKQGISYQGYQVSTADQVYSLGMVEMKNGTAQHVFDVFRQVLGDIDSVATEAGQSNVAKRIVSNLKNSMSDRCVVQKTYNTLVEEYRKEVLPEIIEGWKDLTEEERTAMARMNNFYCGMHYIVGLADSCAAALKVWESSHFGEGVKVGAELLPGTWQGNGGVARLIYSATKAFEKHGDEAAGCVADFHAFLSETKTPLPLEEYRGNRSYVIFRNGAGIYFLHDKMLHFLADVSVRDNQLLRAVKADLSVTELVAGARALGLLAKLVVGPLWCLLEDPTVSILDVSKFYTQLNEKFAEWAKDATDLLDGTARPFVDAKVSVLCDVFTALIEPSESYDALTSEILCYLCSTLAAFSTRILADHLPGGKYHNAPSLAAETASVHKTNAISERDFAQLDRLLREKPNADTVALEGMILFANNKTATWLHSLPPSEQEQLVDVARRTAPSARQQFKDRQAAIRDHRLAELKRKQEEREKKRLADIARKEQLTKDIEQHGLWTVETNVEEKLAAISSVTGQRAALRAQLHFRKFVMEQKAEKELYYMTSGGHVLPIAVIVSNLKKLMGAPASADSA